MKRLLLATILLLACSAGARAQDSSVYGGVNVTRDANVSRMQVSAGGIFRVTPYDSKHAIKIPFDADFGQGKEHVTRADLAVRVYGLLNQFAAHGKEDGFFLEAGGSLERLIVGNSSVNRGHAIAGGGYNFKNRFVGRAEYVGHPEVSLEYFQPFSKLFIFGARARGAYANGHPYGALRFTIGLNLDAIAGS